jgi:hypothetical protein
MIYYLKDSLQNEAYLTIVNHTSSSVTMFIVQPLALWLVKKSLKHVSLLKESIGEFLFG